MVKHFDLGHASYFNYKLNDETLWSGIHILFYLQIEWWNTLIRYTSVILITDWMVKHFDLIHISYFVYKMNGETLWTLTPLYCIYKLNDETLWSRARLLFYLHIEW